MARYSEHDTSKINQAADSFRANCLLSDGSLLFSDASVWRPDVLERIHKAFVATPDEGDRTFIDKFKDQVGKAGPRLQLRGLHPGTPHFEWRRYGISGWLPAQADRGH